MTKRMENVEVVPINFRLTRRAAEKINELTNELSTSEPMLASLFWNQEYDEIERRLIDRGFTLGWFETDRVPAHAVQHIDGVELFFAVDEKQSENFKGKWIDYVNDRFVFRFDCGDGGNS